LSDIFIIGGPNGAGKTTVARTLASASWVGFGPFLNADEIARSISPHDVDGVAFRAGRIMLERMRELVRNGTSFAFETTCSGKSHLHLLKKCQAAGWKVSMMYFWLPSVEHSLQRVAQRVRMGGHGIPEETIRQRYLKGLRNMVHLYFPLVDEAVIYDNVEGALRPIIEKDFGQQPKIVDHEKWSRILEEIDGEGTD
jgi:predicted ABC-type ATPase